MGNEHQYTYKHLHDLLRYDTDNRVDISMSSICSTPRDIMQFEMMGGAGGAEFLNDSMMLMKQLSSVASPPNIHQPNGRMHSQQPDPHALLMSPKLYQQDSTQRLNDSYSLNSKASPDMNRTPSSSMQFKRSSAEVSEIEKEVYKHSMKYSSASFNDKSYDPELMKKNLQMSLQMQLQNLIARISEREKQYIE